MSVSVLNPTTPQPAARRATPAASELACMLERLAQTSHRHGQRMTPLRRELLTLLWRTRRPLKAAELRRRLGQQLGRPIGAASLYRTLDFLQRHGLAQWLPGQRLALRQATPATDWQILHHCSHCGACALQAHAALGEHLDALLARHGFTAHQRLLGLAVRCHDVHCRRGSATVD